MDGAGVESGLMKDCENGLTTCDAHGSENSPALNVGVGSSGGDSVGIAPLLVTPDGISMSGGGISSNGDFASCSYSIQCVCNTMSLGSKGFLLLIIDL